MQREANSNEDRKWKPNPLVILYVSNLNLSTTVIQSLMILQSKDNPESNHLELPVNSTMYNCIIQQCGIWVFQSRKFVTSYSEDSLQPAPTQPIPPQANPPCSECQECQVLRHICHKLYASMPALQIHILTHNLNNKCQLFVVYMVSHVREAF